MHVYAFAIDYPPTSRKISIIRVHFLSNELIVSSSILIGGVLETTELGPDNVYLISNLHAHSVS